MASIETMNVGKAVAARVGSNIREVRTKLSLTQSQLASPEFSISYISAIERGKIRPSLKALAILAKRLDVPLAFLLEGSPGGAAEARAVGYSPADSGPDQRIDVELLQAFVLLQQHQYKKASDLLTPIQADRITTDQAYHLFLLRGQVHLGLGDYQEAVVDLRAAVSQGEHMNDVDNAERARNLLGQAYFSLYNYTLALENHMRCANALESHLINDPVFALDVYSNVAHDFFRHGDLDRAISYYHKAIAILDGMKRDSKSFAEKYMEIGQQYKQAGKILVARDYLMRSLAMYEMRDEQRRVGITHQRLGKARGKLAEAEQEAQAALASARRGDDAQTQGQALIALAQLRHNANDYTGADELFSQALDLLDESNAHELAGVAYSRYANVLEQRGEVQRSLTAFKKAYQHQLQGNRGEIE